MSRGRHSRKLRATQQQILWLALTSFWLMAGAVAAADPPSPPPPAPVEDASVVYVPPSLGAPENRVGGATRGDGDKDLHLDVLAPPQTGLTSSAQPTLYWFNSKAIHGHLQIAITAESADRPLLETDLPSDQNAGIHPFRLDQTSAHLQPETPYRWSVAIVAAGEERSKDTVATGGIELREKPGVIAASAPTLDQVRRAAVAGYWYDAIDDLARVIAAHPDDAALLGARTALLKQVGLDEILGTPASHG